MQRHFFYSHIVEGQTIQNVIHDKTASIYIDAPESQHLDFDLTTGGLKVATGLETYYVTRSNKEHPEQAEGLGCTYQHHPDMAVWHGRMYVGWNSCQVDEDTWLSRELLSSSVDGKAWTKPMEMFPMGISTPLRMYLSYHRGLSTWNNDGSLKDTALWLVFSVNKEAICVIRVPT